jgi:hypothetical protein
MNSSHNSLQVPSLKCCSNLKLVDDVFCFCPNIRVILKVTLFWAPISYNPCFIPNCSIVATWVKLGTIWLKLGTVRKICRIFTLTRRGLMSIWAAVKVRKPGLIPSSFPVYCFHPEILFPGPSTPSLGYIKGDSNMYLHWISVHSTRMGGPILSSLFLGTFLSTTCTTRTIFF